MQGEGLNSFSFWGLFLTLKIGQNDPEDGQQNVYSPWLHYNRGGVAYTYIIEIYMQASVFKIKERG